MKFSPIKPHTTATATAATTPPASDASYALGQIQFLDATEKDAKPPFILATYGDPGAGKSYLCGSAPGDIGVLALEYKSLPSILPVAKSLGKRVILPCDSSGAPLSLIRNSRAPMIAQLPAQCIVPEDLPQYVKYEDQVKEASRRMQAMSKSMRYTDPVPTCCQQHIYRAHFNREKAAGLLLAEQPGVKTIVIDTFGQFVEDGLFACYGRTEAIMPLDKKSFNQEIRDFLNCISVKNVILTHHSNVIWKDNKPTAKTKPMTTFSKLGHYTTVLAKLSRNERADVERGEVRYRLEIEDCLANPALIGETLTDESINFLTLATMVYPDVDAEVWE